MVLIITICENKIVNHFLEEKQELFLKKSYLIFLWKIKYLPVLLLLICTMVLTTQKMWYINTYGLIYSAIIMVIFLLASEIFRLSLLRLSSKNIEREVNDEVAT